MRKVILGIDNGVTGSMCMLSDELRWFGDVPVKKGQDYTKAKNNITRVDCERFIRLCEEWNGCTKEPYDLWMAVIERPMINPMRWKASMSAIRCLEAELTILESLGIPYQFIDSKQWQRDMLPKGCEDTKKASMDIGTRLFPQWKDYIKRHKDADGALIAEWARREGL